MSYNPNIPTPTQNLSVSQGFLKDNFTYSNISFGKDHYPFDDGTVNNGYHKDVHIVKRVGNPATVADTLITFSKDYTPNTTGGVADTQLFARTALGGVSQLTGNLVGNDGWCWCGGILIQWGNIELTTGSGGTQHRDGSVTFKDRVTGAIPFPNACFVVLGNPTCAVEDQSSPASTTFSIFSKSATDFKWNFNTSANISNNPFIYWVAIGN